MFEKAMLMMRPGDMYAAWSRSEFRVVVTIGQEGDKGERGNTSLEME